MGFGKERNKIRERISAWHCIGYFGYGHGRSVKEFGEKPLKDKSVCVDICPDGKACRMEHHKRMDERFPEVAKIVQQTANAASMMRRPVVRAVVSAMQVAESRGVPGTDEMRRVLSEYKVADMTDHYMVGQFENIQNGIDLKDPSFKRPIPSLPQEKIIEERKADESLGGEMK